MSISLRALRARAKIRFATGLSTQEELQYLKACAALGIDPNTGEKVDNGKQDRGNPVPNGADKGPRGESLTAMTQRLERERAEENRRNWLEHCDRMYRTHVGIAQEWAQKRADILQEGVSRLDMPYARDSAGRRISMPGNATHKARPPANKQDTRGGAYAAGGDSRRDTLAP